MEQIDNFQNFDVIEYCRKSTDSDDRQVASLGLQHESNTKTIERHKLKRHEQNVVMESKSAKSCGRPLFNQMIGDIRSGKFNVIVTYTPDRLARNSRDAGELIGLLDDGKIKAIYTSQQVFTKADKMILHFLLIVSEQFRDDLSKKVTEGMKSKALKGYTPGRPKAGYKNINNEAENVVQVIDNPRFELIQKAIKLYLKGDFTVFQVVTKLNDEWGFRTRKTKRTGDKPMSKSNFYNILKDPYYYGLQVWGGYTTQVNKSITRMITEDEYWRVQELLGRKGIQRPRILKENNLPYRGLIKCGECGSTYIPYKQRKKLADDSIKYYDYIKCNRNAYKHTCKQKQMKIEEIDIQIRDLLDTIEISNEFLDWAIRWLREENKINGENHQQEVERITSLLHANEGKRSRLVDAYLLEVLTKEELEAKSQEIEAENKNLTRRLSELGNNSNKWVDKTIETLEFARKAKEKFINGTFEDKTSILRAIGSEIIVTNKQLSIKLQKPFIILRENIDLVGKNTEIIKPTENIDKSMETDVSQDVILIWSG